jgi:hypothetical protein
MMRRGGLELYFVLYLAALMLLLSDSPRRETELASTAIRSLVSSTFALIVEKPTLLCRAIVEGDTIRILHFDSLNTIVPTGLVDSLRYTITITDQATGTEETTAAEGSLEVGNVRLLARQIGQALRIHWQITPRRQSQLYRVRIVASAQPQLPATIPVQQRQQLEPLLAGTNNLLRSEATFLVGYLAEQRFQPQQAPSSLDTALEWRIRSLLAQQSLPQSFSGTFSIVPEHSLVETIPFVTWENRVAVYGASLERDITQPPSVSGIGNVVVTIEGNTLLLRGITTQAGSAQARIRLVRRDGIESAASFTVVSTPVQAPSVPTAMYPGIEYRIEPNLPQLSGTTPRAVLRDESGVIRASSNGQPLVFTPSIADTGRRFLFERYAGTERIGQTIAIACEMFPSPEIISIRRESEQLYHVVTRSYGLASDARSRVRLELEPPSAGRIQELYGDQSYDADNHIRLQHFRVQLQTIASVRALNGYGQRSPSRELSPR